MISLNTILLVAMLAGCSATDAASRRAAAVAKGKALVEADRDMIARFAHPTATLQAAEFLNCADENAGFKLVYKFNFVSGTLKESFDSTLGFVFDDRGGFQFSTVEGTTAMVEPYKAASLARRAIPYDYFARALVPDARQKTEPKAIQDFILKSGGSRALFPETLGRRGSGG